jgi:hypothetical protein
MRPGRFSKLRLAKSRASNSKQLHIPCVHHFVAVKKLRCVTLPLGQKAEA